MLGQDVEDTFLSSCERFVEVMKIIPAYEFER